MLKKINELARVFESGQTICQTDLGAEKVSLTRTKAINVFVLSSFWARCRQIQNIEAHIMYSCSDKN